MMAESMVYAERERRLKLLEEDVREGKIKRDTLVNSAFKFEKEVRAMYYSNARKNIETYTAGAIMNHNQQLDDLAILRNLKR